MLQLWQEKPLAWDCWFKQGEGEVAASAKLEDGREDWHDKLEQCEEKELAAACSAEVEEQASIRATDKINF